MFSTSIVRKLSSMSVSKPWTVKLPKRYQGGRLEKWGNYWAAMAQDYKEVFVEVLKSSREKPFKASVYMSMFGALIYAIKTNPNDIDFRDLLQKSINESAMLTEKIRNHEVDDHLHYIADCYSHDLIRRLNLGFMSLLWVDNYGKVCGVYKTQCEYLKPRYLTFHERIIDIGFLGSWWILEEKMKEFDVNPSEWDENGNKVVKPS